MRIQEKLELVSIETATLAREKGFDWEVSYLHQLPDSMNHDGARYKLLHRSGRLETNQISTMGLGYHPNHYDGYVSLPSQSLLQKWLRDVHMIFVNPNYDHIRNDGSSYVKYGVMTKSSNSKEGFDTYEQALEAGLLKALKLIENEKV